jgi:hypothetical protein
MQEKGNGRMMYAKVEQIKIQSVLLFELRYNWDINTISIEGKLNKLYKG